MDIFTILVFFLLVNSSEVETLPNTKDLQLPESITEKKPRETVVILIGKSDIIVQGTPVAKIADVLGIKGNDIPALRQALRKTIVYSGGRPRMKSNAVKSRSWETKTSRIGC